jgi:Arc/MetJ-type ribon-helix-helix transcriptional regulator
MARTITIKLPAELASRLRAAVDRRGRTQSDIVREALESHLDGRGAASTTFVDLTRDLAGSVSGPADLSSHRRHLRGYGRR